MSSNKLIDTVGITIGTTVGAIKGYIIPVAVITWGVVWQTLLLGGIGAFGGFFVTLLLKWLFKNLIKKIQR